METVTLFPALIMDPICPYCEAKGKVTFHVLPERDFKVSCPKCQGCFQVHLNKRRYYRKEVSIPVSYSYKDINSMDEMGSIMGFIKDLSREGMAVETNSRWYSPAYFREGRVYTFVFFLSPKNVKVKIKGVLKRILDAEVGDTFRIGVHFIDLDEFAGKQIGFFLFN